MKTIALTKGKFAKVDDDDFDRVSKFKWTYSHGYAQRTEIKGGIYKKIYMHRFILGAPKGSCIDHISTDGLDNQKANLRLATRQQNGCNRGKNKANTSGFKGVFLIKSVQKWMAQIVVNRKSIYLGIFSTTEEAYLAYQKAARHYHGEFARA